MMPRSSVRVMMFVALAGLLGIAGCSDVPKAPPRFKIDPEQAAQEAMRLYDKDGDGKINAKELEASPPLRELLLNIKAKSAPRGEPVSLTAADALTAADIQARLEEWNKSPSTLVSARFTVELDGKPLEGATVTFEPEPFLGASFKTHTGKTDAAGNVELDPDLPQYPRLMYVGLYKVSVSKMVNGKELIPAKYNKQTTLGRELASGVRDSRANVFIRLTSK